MICFDNPQAAASWLKNLILQSHNPGGSLSTDSRLIGAGDAFIAWPGAVNDGRQYVGAALAAGAVACMVEHNGAENFDFKDTRIATYCGLKVASGPLAAAFFNQPSQQLRIVAVTGTNGKTTTAWWLAAALGKLGTKAAAIGTLGIGAPGQVMLATGLTTPDPVLLQRQLRRLVDEDFAAAVVEASSIGIVEHRLDGLAIEAAIFTNFTQDHLDYHGSMQSYWLAKSALFDWPGLKAAVVNTDDPHGSKLAARLLNQNLDVWTTSAALVGNKSARLQAINILEAASGLQFDVLDNKTGEQFLIQCETVGLYNVSNIVGVLAALCALGVPLCKAVHACQHLPAVPGRSQMLAVPGQPLVVIDYAHTPDALEKILSALRPGAQLRGGLIECVFGCGGNRDTAKRPLMAAAAEKGADRILLTNDNPRNENPLAIIDNILQGFVKLDFVKVEPDRKLAIVQSISRAAPEDTVLIAGKGHEDTQEIAGFKASFSDGDEAMKALYDRVAESNTELVTQNQKKLLWGAP